MKKLLASIAATALICTSAFAEYDVVPGAQNMLRFSEPQLLTGAASAAGGALYDVTPSSVVNNPAVTAYEQRIVADLAGTVLIETDHTGFAGQAGLTIPTRWGVSTFLFQCNFIELGSTMNLGNGINFIGSFAKDVTDQLSIGMSANFGYCNCSSVNDWKAGVDMGAFYNFGELGPFQDLRFGGSLLNLGKMYSIDSVSFPGLATPKAGVAGTFLKKEHFVMGASLDVSSPSFQNFVLDAGLQVELNKIVKISTAWEYDAREFDEGARNIMPSVGVSFKFRFNSKDGSMLAEHGWAESDMTVSGAWQQMYEDINAISGGCVLKLGLEDETAPEIILWGEE